MTRCALLMLSLVMSSCAYKIKLNTNPLAANVDLPNGTSVVTPAEVTLRYAPFGRQRIVVSAPGYRVVEIDLRKTEIKLVRYISDAFFRPRTWQGEARGQVNIVLVPNHGPVGTWDPTEVP
jgi:hypothetical protein